MYDCLACYLKEHIYAYIQAKVILQWSSASRILEANKCSLVKEISVLVSMAVVAEQRVIKALVIAWCIWIVINYSDIYSEQLASKFGISEASYHLFNFVSYSCKGLEWGLSSVSLNFSELSFFFPLHGLLSAFSIWFMVVIFIYLFLITLFYF